jgi:hypothetical protein
LVDLLVRHREKLRRLDPDTEQMRTLQFLVEALDSLRQEPQDVGLGYRQNPLACSTQS